LGGTLKAILLLALGCFAIRAGAASVTNNSSADTSLLEIEPSHNNGGQAFVISGAIQAPPINPKRTRALYRFDFTSLPTNALIQAVVLELTVTKRPGDGLANSAFGLYRMLRPWGEGNKVAVIYPGQGLPATEGEATWSHSFYPTNAWTLPGAAPDVDFVSGQSGYADISFTGPYRFGPTPELVDDVQRWVNDPQSNFGWILICADEGTQFTARHFGSREDPNAHPNLEVEFSVPLQIQFARRLGNQFQLGFTTWPGQTFEVQFRDSLSSGSWQTLTNTGPVTNTAQLVVSDSVAAPQRFYRVVAF